MNAYTPEQARRMEDALIVLWKPAPGAGRLPQLNKAYGSDPVRLTEAESKRQEILPHITSKWQNAPDVARKVKRHPYECIRTAISTLVRMGRAEGRKVNGVLQVRRTKESLR